MKAASVAIFIIGWTVVLGLLGITAYTTIYQIDAYGMWAVAAMAAAFITAVAVHISENS